MKPLCACIVETRALTDLVEIIRDKHLKYLPEGTQLIILHSKENEQILKDAFPNAGFSLLEGLNSVNDYNSVLTCPEVWKQLEIYSKVLVFQSDSELLKEGIEEFMVPEISFIGARWAWNPNHIGNGGLSLRDPKIMSEVISRVPWDGSLNEDHYFTKAMYDHKIGQLATHEMAEKFSVEAVFGLGSLGYHAIDKWLTPLQCQEIRLQYQK